MVVGGGGFGLLVDGRDHTCALDVFWILDLAFREIDSMDHHFSTSN